jgi:hypothetical protein
MSTVLQILSAAGAVNSQGRLLSNTWLLLQPYLISNHQPGIRQDPAGSSTDSLLTAFGSGPRLAGS